MKRIKIGILGTGKIAHRVVRGIAYVKNAEVVACVSCSGKAPSFAKEYGIARAYSNYLDLVNDAEVDLIYICTPPFLHFDHVKLCLEHGKNVLCEKPFMCNEQEIKEAFELARMNHCFLMEAQKSVFTPLNQKLSILIQEGIIGKLLYVSASYFMNVDFPQGHFALRQDSGGSSYDVGVYPISYANFIVQSTIKDCQVMVRNCGVCDAFMQAMIEYENGVQAYVASSFDFAATNKALIYGEKGTIEIENFWKSKEAKILTDGGERIIQVDMDSDFTGEIQHAVNCILEGKLQSPIMSEVASLEVMKVLNKTRKKEA